MFKCNTQVQLNEVIETEHVEWFHLWTGWFNVCKGNQIATSETGKQFHTRFNKILHFDKEQVNYL